jgi:predicted small lipoprotein YifL
VRSVRRLVQVSSLLALLAALAACNGKGIQTPPEDMNVSPRSQEAYDPVYEELENDPADDKKEQQ